MDLRLGTGAGSQHSDARGDTYINIENVRGSEHDDTITSGLGANVIDGRGGADTVIYRDDTAALIASLATGLIRQGGALSTGDWLLNIAHLVGTAGFGDDLTGSYDANQLFGLGGDDVLEGLSGADLLDGGDGQDTARYDSSNGAVTVNLATGLAQGGHAEGDRLVSIENLIGSFANDTLIGSDVDNRIDGGDGFDRLDGGAGDDVFVASRGADHIHGGTGRDTIVFAQSALDFAFLPVRIDLEAGADNFGHRYTSVENIVGGLGADQLSGDDANNRLDGGAGDDVIYGRAGDDVLVGGPGNDLLDGGSGSDTVSYAKAGARVTVFLARAEQDLGPALGVDRLTAVENLIATEFNDRLSGDAGDNRLEGGPGDDVLTGLAGDDHLIGGAGKDQLNGAGGADQLQGGSGADHLSGMGGPDVLFGGAGADVIHGGLGLDRIDGGAGNDAIFGDFGADTLHGGPGADNIRGDGSADILHGGPGFDRLVGGNGSDRLFGGPGNDVLFGGGGDARGDGLRDVFVFKRADLGGGGFDIIRDFEDGRDKLEFRDSGYQNAEAAIADAAQVGAHVEITLAFGGLLRIENLDLTALTAGDFLF